MQGRVAENGPIVNLNQVCITHCKFKYTAEYSAYTLQLVMSDTLCICVILFRAFILLDVEGAKKISTKKNLLSQTFTSVRLLQSD